MSEYLKYRLTEIFPGLMIWLTLAAAIILSFIMPFWVVCFIIIYDFFWFLRVVNFSIHILTTYFKYRKTGKINWLDEVKTLPRFQKIWHLIFLPTYREDIAVVRGTFEALSRSFYPKDRLIIVLAGEERDKENFTNLSEQIKKEYGNKFGHLIVTLHLKDLPDEIPGKGSNLNFAGHCAKEKIDEWQIPYENVIVSSFDIDTCVHPQYFAYLAHVYLNHPKPTRVSYQPMAFYNNNMWETPSLVRVSAFGTTFWLMMELGRPERLVTFSSHSMSFRALVDIDFWQKNIVTEDSRIFFQCLLRYHGDYSVEPLYLPVSMDTPTSQSHFKSLIALYKQQRRWAWGIEHFPYLVKNFAGDKLTPLWKRIKFIWNAWEGMFSWAMAPMLIFLLGQLPLRFASWERQPEVIFQNAPHILQYLMTAAMVGALASAILSMLLLPPRPKIAPTWKYLIMLLQWILVPVTFIVFGSIPAIDAQTRLMLGKYLGFNVTEKLRKDATQTP
jgi:cellulose synthase/poly-beta-1,6-N-acetylglucosamine synthase-like glycosyltransferase